MNLISTLETSQQKAKLPQIQSGDTVRVHQTIREGNKSRVQVFEGVVIRYRKTASLQAFLTVRKIASGIGVEKSWFVHSPNVVKVEIVRRAKVRRAFISYMRGLRGKKARLADAEFDKSSANESDNRTAKEIADEKAQASADELAATSEDQVEVVASTDELAREENSAARAADPSADEAQPGQDTQDLQNAQGDDEAQLPAQETEAGIEREEKATTKRQDK